MRRTTPNVVLGLLGTTLDKGRSAKRWNRWRPTVDLVRQNGLKVDRLELLHGPGSSDLAAFVAEDIVRVSSSSTVKLHELNIQNWWDFEDVYSCLYDFVETYPFDADEEHYLVHITTGSHVAQICWFLLVEARLVPGTLLQTAPPETKDRSQPGHHHLIDLNLARYDAIARRFSARSEEGASFLKSGIQTRNSAFNRLISELEQVVLASQAPILLLGPTGAGKSQLARRIYELRKLRRRVEGPFVEVNCATLRGDSAMSALFGHEKGAFTGAISSRPGLLRAANKGVLFLDEIAELGLDEQAMLLRALEEQTFLPVGADAEVKSQFSLIAGTNRDLATLVTEGKFRDDLLARIDLWTFEIPGLSERPEDIEPNLEFELARLETLSGDRVSFNREAQEQFLAFATRAPWPRNFRDFSASLARMATLAPGGRINRDTVQNEVQRLQRTWEKLSETQLTPRRAPEDTLKQPPAAVLPNSSPPPTPWFIHKTDLALSPDIQAFRTAIGPLDRFDEAQLYDVLTICATSDSISDAGRRLFSESRQKKRNPNDSDRLRKYLARHRLDFSSARNLGRQLLSFETR